MTKLVVWMTSGSPLNDHRWIGCFLGWPSLLTLMATNELGSGGLWLVDVVEEYFFVCFLCYGCLLYLVCNIFQRLWFRICDILLLVLEPIGFEVILSFLCKMNTFSTFFYIYLDLWWFLKFWFYPIHIVTRIDNGRQ